MPGLELAFSITEGVTIGEGAIVGSNSVVIQDVPAFSVLVSNSAHIIRKDTRTNTGKEWPQ